MENQAAQAKKAAAEKAAAEKKATAAAEKKAASAAEKKATATTSEEPRVFVVYDRRMGSYTIEGTRFDPVKVVPCPKSLGDRLRNMDGLPCKVFDDEKKAGKFAADLKEKFLGLVKAGK